MTEIDPLIVAKGFGDARVDAERVRRMWSFVWGGQLRARPYGQYYGGKCQILGSILSGILNLIQY